MPYTMSAQLIGAKELSDAFKRAPEVVGKELYNAVYDGMRELQSTARNTAPHKTGRLQASIDTDGPRITSNNVVGRVGTNVEYAPVQEFGRGPFILLPVKKKALYWKGASHPVRIVHHPGIRAKYYFKRSIETTQPKFTEIMQRAIGRIINYLARS